MSLRESVFARREKICIRRPCLYLARCVPDSHVYSTEVVYRDRPQAWMSGVRIPAGARTFSSKLPHLLWDSHSLLMNGYRGSFSGGKAAAAWSWPHTSLQCWGEEWVELHLYCPYMPSRHGKGQLFPTSTVFEGQNTYYEYVSVQKV
jgi:hypothetical protein